VNFEDWLVKQYTEGNNIVVFIDEAQKLDSEQLELVRTLLNFETDKEKLIQIVLAETWSYVTVSSLRITNHSCVVFLLPL